MKKWRFGNFLKAISQYNQLVSDYKRAVETSPDHAMAHVNWGIDLAQAGKMDEALAKFEAAAAMAPTRWEVFTNWGVALARTNRLDEAVAKFQHALHLSPNSASNYVLWGAALMEQGHLEEAARKYEKAIELAPDNPEPYVNWGIALSKMGDYYGALKNFKTALALHPYQPQVYFLWGAVAAELEDYETAIEKFKTTLRFVPKHADSYYFWSVALNRLGKYEEALEKSKKALHYQIDKEEERPEIYLNQGDILANLGRHELAISNYKQAVALDPKLAEAYLSWGVTLCKMGQYKEGFEKLHQAENLAETQNHSLPGIHKAYGQYLLQQGKAQEALPHLEKADAEMPNQVDILLNWAMALIKCGRTELALEKLHQIEKKDRWNPQMHYLLGTHFMGAGAYQEAEQHLKKALTERPDFEDAAINLSLVLCELGDTAEAVRQVRPVLRKSPESPRANFFYGTVLYHAGEYTDAEEKLQKALRLDPTYVEPKIGLGELYLKQERYPEADRILKQLLVEKPQLVPALYLFGLSAMKQGRTDEARHAFEAALAVSPHHLETRCRLAQLTQSQDMFEELLSGFSQPLPQAMILWAWAEQIQDEQIDLAQSLRHRAQQQDPTIEAHMARHWL